MKKWAKFLLLFAVLLPALGADDCESTPPPPSAIKEKRMVEQTQTKPAKLIEYDLSATITRGDHSYIPINKGGTPGDQASEILGLLNHFGSQHPELEVVDWKIEKQQQGHVTRDFIFGVWIDHKLKTIKREP